MSNGKMNEGNQQTNVSSRKTDMSGGLTTGARYGRYIFAVLAAIFALCVVVQVFLAGMAIFVNPVHWGMHMVFVRFFTFLPVVMFIFSFIGRVPKGMRWVNLVMFAMIIAQYITAGLSSALPIVSALHPVIALMLFGASLNVARQAWRLGFGKERRYCDAHSTINGSNQAKGEA